VKVIQTPNAPLPIGSYSQAIQSGNWVFLSGQIGMDPRTLNLVAGGTQGEITQVFKNILAIVKSLDATLANIVKLTVFLTDLADYALVNETMKQLFSEPFPARSVVQVSGLPKQARVEIEALIVLA